MVKQIVADRKGGGSIAAEPVHMGASVPLARNVAHSIEGVSQLTGIGRTSIYSAIRSNELKARKFRRRTVILESDLRAWLQALPEVRAAR
jgi:excisionase family DNA binding protein